MFAAKGYSALGPRILGMPLHTSYVLHFNSTGGYHPPKSQSIRTTYLSTIILYSLILEVHAVVIDCSLTEVQKVPRHTMMKGLAEDTGLLNFAAHAKVGDFHSPNNVECSNRWTVILLREG